MSFMAWYEKEVSYFLIGNNSWVLEFFLLFLKSITTFGWIGSWWYIHSLLLISFEEEALDNNVLWIMFLFADSFQVVPTISVSSLTLKHERTGKWNCYQEPHTRIARCKGLKWKEMRSRKIGFSVNYFVFFFSRNNHVLGMNHVGC